MQFINKNQEREYRKRWEETRKDILKKLNGRKITLVCENGGGEDNDVINRRRSTTSY